ncbi:MAG: type I methionyl aminopeptidase [Candidatus Saccharimonadales bacterium]
MQPKTDKEIKAIRASGRMLAITRDLMAKNVVAGITTKEIADIGRKELKSLGGEPAFLNYMGFPDIVCISVNSQVVHGIPSKYIVKSGDLVSIDFGVKYQGMITDSAVTVVAENQTSGRVRKLLKATEESLYAGIDQVKAGAKVGDISNAIEKRLRQDGLGVVEDLIGHGVGHKVHEDPEIPNYGLAGTGPVLKENMTIAIEPMATLGSKEVFTELDNWAMSTVDNSLSAHFEHTVLVLDKGYEVLTSSS